MKKNLGRNYISIDGIELNVMELRGNCFFVMELKEEEIPGYCRKILENQYCQHMLPMRFIRERCKLWAYYDYGGYLQLKDIFKIWHTMNKCIASKSIEAIIAVAQCIISAENYLLYCENFRLHIDSVFIRANSGEVRLAYIPKRGHCAGVSYGLASLIRDTAQIACDEQWSIYAEEIYKRIEFQNESISTIKKILQEKGREICSRGWPDKSQLRKG